MYTLIWSDSCMRKHHFVQYKKLRRNIQPDKIVETEHYQKHELSHSSLRHLTLDACQLSGLVWLPSLANIFPRYKNMLHPVKKADEWVSLCCTYLLCEKWQIQRGKKCKRKQKLTNRCARQITSSGTRPTSGRRMSMLLGCTLHNRSFLKCF